MADKKLGWLRPASIGTHFFACTLIGYLIGHYLLDAWFDSEPLWTVVMILLGTVAGFVNLIREVNLINKAESERPAPGPAEDWPYEDEEETEDKSSWDYDDRA